MAKRRRRNPVYATTPSPGPWLSGNNWTADGMPVYGATGRLIAFVAAQENKHRGTANVDLIKASPILLRAAKAMLDADPSSIKEQSRAAAALYKAIDKAEGRFFT
jgi:hypothetical protein